MELGDFIKSFSHNNVIRLLYKTEDGHETVLSDWNVVSMDWEVNKQRGEFRHYINNEVVGLTSVYFGAGQGIHHIDAINIVIEKLEPQPYLDDDVEG